jgi:hypothetical protein
MMRSRLEIRDGHVHLEVGGAFDAEAGRRLIGEVFEACAAHRVGRVFVDARGIEATVAIAERFEMARALADSRSGPVKIAVLVDPPQMVTKTFEDSACNRGVPVRTTVDAQEAYRFLGLEPPA